MEFDQKSFAIEQHYRKGRPLPAGLQDVVDREPDLEPFEEFYMIAYWRLLTERRGGPVVPYSEIRNYAERKSLDPPMTEVLISVIRFLEHAHNEWHKQEQERAKIASKPSPAKRAKKK